MVTRSDTAGAATTAQPKFINSKTLFATKCECTWGVDQILVEQVPMVIGGPKKTLKTSLALDLGISLSTGAPFLDTFAVPSRRKVAVVSAECGRVFVEKLARRICNAKGVSPELACNVYWSFGLPRFQDSKYSSAFQEFLQKRKVNVVILDPLYLFLLYGNSGTSPYNLYEVGPHLFHVTQICLEAGAVPIFIHHTTKNSGKQSVTNGKPLELDDLAFSGIGEFARQWLLVSRATPYRPESHEHSLILSAGNSNGHSACWKVAINEGKPNDQHWEVQVASMGGTMELKPKTKRTALRKTSTAFDSEGMF